MKCIFYILEMRQGLVSSTGAISGGFPLTRDSTERGFRSKLSLDFHR